jgi:ubiquinone/menaquinone biosynthesis C-methylase UbiE
MQNKQEKLRQTFDIDPVLYDSARPYYPDSLFTKLLEATQISEGASLLEIGLGTGRATAPLADRGFKITAIDIGTNMVKFAQQKFAQYTNVEVINASFEVIELTKNHFDLIYSATAFHWIDPKVKYAKSHELLKQAGYLAIIGTEHVSDEHGDDFFHATQPLYNKWIPSETNNGYRLPEAVDILPEPFDEELFSPILFDKFPVRIDYDTVTYCELLRTFSDLLSLPKAAQEGFLGEMAELIRGDFNDKITKHSVISLSIARKI